MCEYVCVYMCILHLKFFSKEFIPKTAKGTYDTKKVDNSCSKIRVTKMPKGLEKEVTVPLHLCEVLCSVSERQEHCYKVITRKAEKPRHNTKIYSTTSKYRSVEGSVCKKKGRGKSGEEEISKHFL